MEKSNISSVRAKDAIISIGEFDGKERRLKFDLNAFAELEDRFGSLTVMQERLKGGSIKDIRTLLWVGLLWEHTVYDEDTGDVVKYTISPNTVGKWLDLSNIPIIMKAVGKAISGALPEGATQKAVAAAGEPTIEAKN